MRNPLVPVLAGLAGLLSTYSSLHAESGTWSQTTGGTYTWGTPGNWSGGTVADGAGFTANFATFDVGNMTVNLEGPRTIGNLIFGDASGTNTWTLGNALTPANILTLQGVTAPTVTVQNNSATISAAIDGTQGLTKDGAGTLTLSGTNTFTGGIIVNNGRLNFSGDLALGAAGGSVTLNSGTFGSSSSNVGTFGTGRSLIVNGASTIVGNGFSPHTYAFNISGAGQLTLNGSTTRLILSGSNDLHTGGMVISGGRVQFASSAALPTGSILISNGGLEGSGAYASVAAWLASGRINTASTGAILLTSASSENIDFTGYNDLMFGASSAVASSVEYSGVLTPANSTYRFGGGGVSTTLLNLVGANALTGARSAVFGNSTTTGASATQLSNANDFSGGSTVTQGARVVLTHNQGLGSGAVTVTSGEVQLRNNVTVNNELFLSGDPLGVTGLGQGTLRNNSGVNTWAGNITLNSSSRISSDEVAGNLLTISGDINLSTYSLILQTGTSSSGTSTGGNIVVTGDISGTGSITKSSMGVLTLSGSNSYLGNTSINAGMVVIGNASALGNGTTLNFGGNAVGMRSADNTAYTIDKSLGSFGQSSNATSTITFGDSTGVANGSLIFNSTASTSLNGGQKTFQVYNTTTINAVLTSSGTLNKTGAGTLILNGVNTYTGPTNINAGTLLINGSLAATSAVTVADGATLGGSGRVGAISGAGMIAPGNSPGILTATSINPSAGMDFSFQLTSAQPNWANASAPGNDVFRLTAATPITMAMTSANVFNIYLSAGGTFVGGIFTDANSDFSSLVANATFNYYILSAGGPFTYDGQTYMQVSGTWDVVQVASANFADGTVSNGWAMQYDVVPEPSTVLLLAVGSALVLFRLRRRQA